MRTKIGLAIVFVIAWPIVQADQLTMLTDFGLPKRALPSQFVDANGTFFFVTAGGETIRSCVPSV